MRVTQSTAITSDFSWIGAIVTVTCTITEIRVPSLPTETTYLIGSGPLEITMAPAFTQYPPCDYVLTETKMWQFNPQPAPVQPSLTDSYKITIESTQINDARVQQLTFLNTIDYLTQQFTPSVTFNIELLHPCRRTTFNDITISTIDY